MLCSDNELFAAALPVSVRVLSLVMPSAAVPLLVEKAAIAGVTGAVASMMTFSALEAAPSQSLPCRAYGRAFGSKRQLATRGFGAKFLGLIS